MTDKLFGQRSQHIISTTV